MLLSGQRRGVGSVLGQSGSDFFSGLWTEKSEDWPRTVFFASISDDPLTAVVTSAAEPIGFELFEVRLDWLRKIRSLEL